MSDDDFEIRPGRIKDRGGRPGARSKSLARAASCTAQPSQATVDISARIWLSAWHRSTWPRADRGAPDARQSSQPAPGRRSRRGSFGIEAPTSPPHRSPATSLISSAMASPTTGRRRACSDAGSEEVDGDIFAERCADDRHHFRFIVSPEDATDMTDLKAFTRDLMPDMEADLGTGSTGSPSITGTPTIPTSTSWCAARPTTAAIW
jgi:hypothetical protein